MSRAAFAGLLSLLVVPAALAQAQWSTVRGKVVYDESKSPVPRRVVPDTKGVALPPCAAKDKDFLTEDWIVDPKTKAVKDVVVWLAPEPTPAQWMQLKAKGKDRLRDFPSFKPADIHPAVRAVPTNAVEIDQPCCRFIPHQTAIRVGQSLVIKNSAAFAHNANYNTDNNGSDNSLIPEGKQIAIPIRKSERSEIKIQCNIHGWMWASVRVFDHPYFAVTNEKGEYEIKDAPVGQFRVFVWHSAGGYSGGNDGRFGYELKTTPIKTEVLDYSVTGKPPAK